METLTKPASDSQKMPPDPEDLRGLSLYDQFEEVKKFLFADSDPGDTGDPAAETELEFVNRTADELADKTWAKISQQLGSNEGGWYENKASGERFYLKFYDDPDQARVEFLANQIYAYLDIKAARTELVEVDGRLGLASAEIAEAADADAERQRNSPDVRAGFVADAYLANWDVVGLCYDNIVAGPGGLYRIDNGGAMTFRGGGGLKDFPADDVVELKTMQDPEFTAGSIFGGITESEMAAQARELTYLLYPELLEQLVFGEAGLTGEAGDSIYRGLIGRRQFLIYRFGLEGSRPPEPPGSRLRGLIDKINRRRETEDRQPESLKLRDREVIISDEDHIENQTVNVIDARDRGCLEVRFKLTASHYQKLVGRLQDRAAAETAAGEIIRSVKDSDIVYRDAGPDCQPILEADAFELRHDNLSVKIGRPVSDTDDETGPTKSRSRSFLGLVAIDIPYRDSSDIDLDAVEDRLNDVLVNLLEIPAGLAEPTPEAERSYKQARYGWHHRLDPEIVAQDHNEIIDYLRRREVFDNYSTIVCPGMYYHYEHNFGEYAPYHNLLDPELITSILANGGLMSSHERYSRGQPLEGMSTLEDLNTGGGDSVFVRTILDSPAPTPDRQTIPGGHYQIVMGPELFDRTDWYSYPRDYYGSTDEQYFDHRQSPAELLASQQIKGTGQIDEEVDGWANRANEQMFRTGISSKAFRGIACHQSSEDKKRLTDTLLRHLVPDEEQRQALYHNGQKVVRAFLERECDQKDIVNAVWDEGPEAVRGLLATYGIRQIAGEAGPQPVDDWLGENDRMNLIDLLRRAGYDQINGRSVEDFVVEAQNQYDFIDIAHDRPVRSKNAAQDQAYNRPEPAARTEKDAA